MKTYVPRPGETINRAAEEMVDLANFTGEVVTAEMVSTTIYRRTVYEHD